MLQTPTLNVVHDRNDDRSYMIKFQNLSTSNLLGYGVVASD